MDDLFGLLIFLAVFILGPLLEQIRKRNQQQQQRPPQQQRPQPRPLPQAQSRPLPRSSTEEISAKPRESAATMVPDDLWKILRGEAPAPVVVPAETKPAPAEKNRRPWDVVYIPPEETEDEEALAGEDVNVELKRTSREAVQREHAQRHKREPTTLEITQANIVSLETPLPSSKERHAAFHEKLAAKPAPAVRRKAPYGLGNRAELQRAFVLQEIFGRPRGLD